MIRRLLVLVIAILLFGSHNAFERTRAAAAEPDHEAVPIRDSPSNIRVDARLVDVVRGMLRVSPTFRDQMQRLGRARHLQVHVTLKTDLRAVPLTSGRAQTVISRYQYGRIKAEVRLWSWVQVQELIAHELEHVREYVEGARYAVLASKRDGHVWMLSSGHFETARAIEVGEQVARESRPFPLELR